MFSAQNLPINSWLQDLTNKAYINVEFGSAISHHGIFDHLVNLVKGSFVSSHEMISIFCQFLKRCFHFLQGTNIRGGDMVWF